MAEHRYDPQEIEPRWQRVWEDEQTWHVGNEPDDREASYVLEMLPYPSGEPHIGHLKVYSVGDAVAHFHRRTGRRVLHPMGYDAFGLPAENHAIRTGQHPRESTEEAIAAFQRQFREWGISIDWSREFGTHEPRYYRWTQWIFLQLFEQGLAYRKDAAVKWCPNDQTVLANEQVVDGRCERCGHLVEARQLEQWFFRITDYADRLLDDLATIEWPEHVKAMQRNWIGRSEGAEVTFRCEELGIDYPVFTTRPDTLFGATFFVMAPEHPDVVRLAAGTGREEEVKHYIDHALTESSEERGDTEKEKTGVPLGRHVVNPVNGERIPMYVADYVLMEYGTGAIMAVPGHDERDFAFAQKFKLPIRRVVSDPDGGPLPYPGDGPIVHSHSDFDGLNNREALHRIVDWLDREGKGHASVSYRLRDWLLSRQRYWGCPIPVIHCPRLRDRPGARGGPARRPARRRRTTSPRAARRWPRPRTGCACLPGVRARGGAARDGHDGHVRRLLLVLPALLRRAQRHRGLGPRGRAGVDARRPVHRRHRARDPAPALRAVLRQGARRPRAPRRAGAVRAALHPGDDHEGRGEDVEVPWQRRLAAGDRRALRVRHRPRLHPLHRAARPGRRLVRRGRRGRPSLPGPAVAAQRGAGRGARRRPAAAEPPGVEEASEADLAVLRKAHWAIEKVTQDLAGRFAFNTAIAAVMELVNEVSRHRDSATAGARRFALATASSLLFGFAPHTAADAYALLTGRRVWEEPWPVADLAFLERDTYELVCQVNGKVRDRVEVPAGAPREELERIALDAPRVRAHIDGHEVVKVVVVPEKLVNVVVR